MAAVSRPWARPRITDASLAEGGASAMRRPHDSHPWRRPPRRRRVARPDGLQSAS
jgi:hypothetical protein